MESERWEMVCEVWEVGLWVMGWWEMLRGMCEKSSTHYKKAPCSLSVVKYLRFIAKMFI
jgi:hypothetical protein